MVVLAKGLIKISAKTNPIFRAIFLTITEKEYSQLKF